MIDHITGRTTFKTIEILIAPDGSTRLETNGFTGNSCREVSRFLEAALGARHSEQLKPEFHQTNSHTQSLPLRS